MAIQKIFQLKPSNWVQGLSPAELYDGGKAIYQAKGIDLFRYPGRLAVGNEFSTISTNTLAATDMEKHPNANYIFACGDNRISRIGVVSDSVTIIHTSNESIFDLEIYDNKLAYSQMTKVGTYDLSSTFNDTAIGGTSFLHTGSHPMKVGADENLYIGNTYKLAKWDGTIGTSNILTFNNGYDIKSLASDGFYLAIGATVGTNDEGRKCYVMFWDLVSGQVNRKWELPDATNIYYLKEESGSIVAFCGNKSFICSFDSPPKELIKNGKERYVFGKRQGKIAVNYRSLLVFQADAGGYLGAYGASEEGFPNSFYMPWYIGATDVSAIEESYGNLYVATSSNKILKLSTSLNLSGIDTRTPFIDLGRDWKIHFIKVQFEKLASGDYFEVHYRKSNLDSDIIAGNYVSFLKDGAIDKKILSCKGEIMNQIQFNMNISGGNPKIKSVELYGEPMAELS